VRATALAGAKAGHSDGTSRHELSVVEAVEALRLVCNERRQSASATEPTHRATRACLGRQPQARAIPLAKKASALPKLLTGKPVQKRLQGPLKHSPQPGEYVWAA